MISLTVRVPGVTITSSDRDVGDEIKHFVELLRRSLEDAMTAYNFRYLTQQISLAHPTREQWRARRDHVLDVIRALERERSAEESEAEFGECRAEAERRTRLDEWNAGCPQWFYWSHLSFQCIHSYVFALHTMRMLADGFLKAIDGWRSRNATLGTELTNERGAVCAFLAAFDALFPGLESARDSLHHMDERARARAYNRPIKLASNILNLGIADPHSFSIVTESGDDVTVAFNAASLETLARTFEDLLASLKWKGPVRYEVL